MKTTTERRLKTVTYEGHRIVRVMAANGRHPDLWVVMKLGSAALDLDSALHGDPRALQACVDLVDRLNFDAAKQVLADLRGETV